MTDPTITARAKSAYEAERARLQMIHPRSAYLSWDELLEIAVTNEGCFDCVRGWYAGVKESNV